MVTEPSPSQQTQSTNIILTVEKVFHIQDCGLTSLFSVYCNMSEGQWNPSSKNQYNLNNAVSRCTTQVYPNSWTAIYIALDNVGMWNLRSEFWSRQYLGQQLYARFHNYLRGKNYTTNLM